VAARGLGRAAPRNPRARLASALRISSTRAGARCALRQQQPAAGGCARVAVTVAPAVAKLALKKGGSTPPVVDTEHLTSAATDQLPVVRHTPDGAQARIAQTLRQTGILRARALRPHAAASAGRRCGTQRGDERATLRGQLARRSPRSRPHVLLRRSSGRDHPFRGHPPENNMKKRGRLAQPAVVSHCSAS